MLFFSLCRRLFDRKFGRRKVGLCSLREKFFGSESGGRETSRRSEFADRERGGGGRSGSEDRRRTGTFPFGTTGFRGGRSRALRVKVARARFVRVTRRRREGRFV
jgi:hypothetical protein